MKMEPLKSKMKRVFTQANKRSFNGRSNVEELEIRPGGMLVQKRDFNSNQNCSLPISTIKVRVKFGSSCPKISISSQASFGELKKMLTEHTGVHHQDQKLIYKKKERDSREFLDVVGVKDGSKIMLIEDITSRERRCLEMLKSAKIEKASKLLQQITSEVDKLRAKVMTMEAAKNGDEKVAEIDIDNLIEILMNKLVQLDGIVADGDLKLQKGLQERRVQKYIETLDMLKLQNAKAKTSETTEIFQVQAQDKMPIQYKEQVLKKFDSFVVTTKWETFD